jgi:hypothetical protein
MGAEVQVTSKGGKLTENSSSANVEAFLREVARTPIRKPDARRGRLVFALDATASRQPTWDRACEIQGSMFEEAASLGGLEIQLVYYRGFRELRSEPWLSDGHRLARQMSAVICLAGQTQIIRVLRHTLAENRSTKVDALVFVGDCMEEDEDQLCAVAGELGLRGVPVFVFHEGGNAVAARAFRQVATVTRGAYCAFDAGSAGQLRDLLSAVAVFAAGGRRALQDFGEHRGGLALRLTHLLREPED